MASKASIRIGPLYHDKFADLSTMLSPCHPEIGTNGILSGLYPTFFKYVETSLLISSYLSWEYMTDLSSYLLRQTIIYLTPRVNASKACSLVYPSLEIPASNSP